MKGPWNNKPHREEEQHERRWVPIPATKSYSKLMQETIVLWTILWICIFCHMWSNVIMIDLSFLLKTLQKTYKVRSTETGPGSINKLLNSISILEDSGGPESCLLLCHISNQQHSAIASVRTWMFSFSWNLDSFGPPLNVTLKKKQVPLHSLYSKAMLLCGRK